MTLNKVFQRRFKELDVQASQIESSKKSQDDTTREFVDNELLLKWKIKVGDLLSKACGENSQYFKQFSEERKTSWHTTNYGVFKELKAIFWAAKEDFEGGYLSSIKMLVLAEIFDSELEQAEELFSSGFLTAAAVIAGVVLETALRELCDRNDILHSSLDKMNADLVKAGVYTKLEQKQITWLAHIRNSAAHGKPDQFTDQNVCDMIKTVNTFLLMFRLK